MMMMWTTLIFVLTVTSALAKDFKPLYPLNPIQDHLQNSRQNIGKLSSLTVTRSFMEGEFRQGNIGIRFRSEGSARTNSITITNASTGKTIFSNTLMGKNTFSLSIMGNKYLVENGQAKKSKGESVNRIHTHKKWREATSNSVELRMRQLGRKYLQYQQTEKMEENDSENDIHRLLLSAEAKLIQAVAFELGKKGYYGRDSTAIMIFYMLALRLAEMKSPSGPYNITSLCLEEKEKDEEEMSEEEQLMASKGLTHCEHTGRYCELDSCPLGDECVGMCGVQCECWNMICGDCCYHQACLTFSKCTSRGEDGSTTFTLSCFDVFGFHCDSN